MELPHIKLRAMLETAIVAARLAGQYAMEQMHFVKASIKNATELVTQADKHCQDIIVSRIKENYPDHGFIAEEGEQGKLFKQPPRGDSGFWWAIDPIDGTNNFAHRIPLFAISVAVLYEGKPVVGVVFDPATDSMFTAVQGQDAQLNGRRIQAGNEQINKFSNIGLDSHLDLEGTIPPWLDQLIKKTRFRNLGTTALQMAYVARGGMVATIINTPKLWDIAAGAVICESAGAVITDWQGNRIFPLDLDSYTGEKFRTLVANKKVHPKLVELLKG